MKFIISKNELAKLVNRVQNIVAPKTPIPILSNILLNANEDGTITLEATDLTVGVRCTGKAKVIKTGCTTLPARHFAQLLKELTASQIEIFTDEKEITHIIAENSTFKINGLPKGEFPTLPDLSGSAELSFKQGELKDMLYKTAFAVSKEDSRYVLTGVYLQIIDGVALFVGTDGKKLARAYLPLDQQIPNSNVDCIIPLKAVDEIIKNLDQPDLPAALFVMSDKIAVQANDMLIMTKLLSGDYPDVDRVIPTEFSHVVSLDRDLLISLVRQIALFTGEKNPSMRFTLHENELFLSANTIDLGEGKVNMSVVYAGPKFDIAFNAEFFLLVLRHCENEKISMGFSDSFNPGIIADGKLNISLKEGFPSPIFVLMPMRLTEEIK